jgi:hypothetical protein
LGGTIIENGVTTVDSTSSSSGDTPVVCGDFTVTGGQEGVDYKFENGVLTILSDADITIQNTDPSKATTNKISVADGIDANITLDNVNIDTSSVGGAAFEIADDSTGNVTVTLVGDNTLLSAYGYAGLQKNGDGNSGTLTITGDGTLTAIGGGRGAGIGGGEDEDASNITISGGTVTAIGGGPAAGIGGGFGGDGSGITISGGTITATGGDSSAGIGGGSGGDGSDITISGGTITATGGINGAGIGGGNSGDGSNITISDGTVTAKGGEAAAGIGGGSDGAGSNITISGGTVTATSGSSDADAIGSGSGVSSTSADVQRLGGTIIENDVTTLGSTSSGNDSVINSDFTVTGGTEGVDYEFKDGVLTILSDADITIKNTDPAVATTNRISVADGVNANITLENVNIDTSSVGGAAFEIADGSTGDVTVTLVGDNTLQSAEHYAGLQKNGDESSGTLTITGDGSLTATSVNYGAGIGGGTNGVGSNITINGGTVTAIGGIFAAGIGGGDGGNGVGSNITISGGMVTATGGAYAAGIGVNSTLEPL